MKKQLARASAVGVGTASAAGIPGRNKPSSKEEQKPVVTAKPVTEGGGRLEFMKNYSTVGGRPVNQTVLHVTDRVMVKGWMRGDDLYHVYLSDGRFVETKTKPKINSAWIETY